MAHFKKTPQVEEGRLIYGDSIVDNIVLYAVREIPNVELCDVTPEDTARSKAIKVSKEKDGIHVDVKVKIHYSQCVSDIAFKIQESVRHAVETMSEYRVANVNVGIYGVNFEDKTEDITPQPNENVQEGNK